MNYALCVQHTAVTTFISEEPILGQSLDPKRQEDISTTNYFVTVEKKWQMVMNQLQELANSLTNFGDMDNHVTLKTGEMWKEPTGR